MEEEKKTPEREEEQALPVQELPTDIPAEVRQKLAEDLNEQATEDLKQDVREAEKEEANDEGRCWRGIFCSSSTIWWIAGWWATLSATEPWPPWALAFR